MHGQVFRAAIALSIAALGVACGGGGGGSSGNSSGGGGTVPANDFLYVSNFKLGEIYIFSVGADGSLTSVAGSPFAKSPPAYGLAVSPNDRFAFFAGSNSNCVAAFSINPTAGTLSPVGGASCAQTVSPIMVAIHPTGRFVYSPNGDEDTASGFSVGSDGALTALAGSPYTTGKQSWSIGIDPTGAFAYVTNQLDNTISGFSINPSTGALAPIPGSPFHISGFVPQEIAFEPTGQFLYLTDNSPGLETYRIDSSTGALTFVPTASIANGGIGLVVDPTGKYLYVANGFNVDGFTIEPSTGKLTAMPLIDYPEYGRASKVILDRSGRYLYSLDNSLQAVWEFSIDPSTGMPTPLPQSPFIFENDPGGSIGPVGFAASH